jgi:hypothetical protein
MYAWIDLALYYLFSFGDLFTAKGLNGGPMQTDGLGEQRKRFRLDY